MAIFSDCPPVELIYETETKRSTSQRKLHSDENFEIFGDKKFLKISEKNFRKIGEKKIMQSPDYERVERILIFEEF